MVKTSLVERDLKEGKRLLEALNKPKPNGRTSFRIKAALWLYHPDLMEWRLVLATPLVDEKGRLATYAHLRKIFDSIHPFNLSTHNITVMSPRDPLAKALRGSQRVGAGSEGEFTRGMVGGTYVENAYIYRLP